MMADHVTYHSLQCRELAVDQRTGELRYQGADEDSVAQFIGPKPLSPECSSFSIEVVSGGMTYHIAMGICHRRYLPDKMPGWEEDSIGYHADDGGIYHVLSDTWSPHQFGRVYAGDVMGCSFDFLERTVTFLRNGTELFTSEPLIIPPGGFYPIVGLHSDGVSVRLLEQEPWSPDINMVPWSKEVVFHSLFCREVVVSPKTGIVRYHSRSPDVPVGHFVSMCPLRPESNKFSVEIASQGQKSGISIGVCHRCYPSNCQPGWLPNSIAYHADDGCIYHGSDKPCSKCPTPRAGDVLSCEFDFSTQTFKFRHNDITIFKSPPVPIPPGGFHAVVGLHSAGEAVCLLERDPWRSAPDKSDDNQKAPKCSICMDKGVARFLIPCGHTFCVECVEEWTADHSTCPVCRVPYSNVQLLCY